jgi:hypothetical protein
MAKFGFCGGTYQSQSPTFAADLTMNLYPEIAEIPTAASGIVLYPTPGSELFVALGGTSVRGIFAINSRLFAVTGSTLHEVFGNGTSVSRGTVLDDGFLVSMAASRTELLVASGGTLYVFTLATNVLTTIPSGTITDISIVEYIDGFFLALGKDSQTFRISNVSDATAWPGDQIIQVSVFPDNIVSMISDHRELWLFGVTKSVVYYDSGSPQIFDVIPGAIIETGIIAPASPAKLDNTIMWLGGDERGPAIVWRAQGYTPKRVSNHAIEFAMQGYTTISDAEGYSYQDQGHSFYVLYFPTADTTWVFDAASGMWHERGFLDLGVFEAHHSRSHTYVFGKHLVGDWSSGNINAISISLFEDNGSPIRRIRRSPHISQERNWFFHHKLQVDIQVGLGPTPPLLDGAGNPRDPVIEMRFSDTSAKTWSNTQSIGFGQVGQYSTRAIWRRLGRSRDRIYEIAVSDPVPVRIVDAYLEVSPGSGG